MRLDTVEIVLRTEELFLITIGDDETATIKTVGDFYKLICAKLGLCPFELPVTSIRLPLVTEKQKKLIFLYKHIRLSAPPEVLPWSPQSVWDSLVAVLIDQQGLDKEQIAYHAHFVDDLGFG